MEGKTKRRKGRVEREVLVSAFVKRKNDILRPDMSVLPQNSPVWSRLASDLGNLYKPITLAQMVRQDDIKEALIAASTIDATYTHAPRRGHRPKPLVTNRTQDRNPCKIVPHDLAIDNVSTRKAQLVLPKGYPNGNVVNEESVSCYTANLEGKQSSLQADNKIHQLQARVEIDDICVSRARFVSTKVCPGENIPKEEPGSPQPVNIADERKLLPNVDHKAQQSEENSKHTVDKIPTRLETFPQTMKNTDDKKFPLNMDHKAQQTEGNLTNIADEISIGKHVFKVDPSVLITEIVSRKDEIVRPTGSYVAQTDPVWQRITNAVGNGISPVTVWRMANRKDIREFMIDNKRGITVASSDVSRGSGNNIERDVIDALLQHRAEIVLPDGSYVSKENPAWFRIARNLGNNVSAIMVCQIAERPDVRERIVNGDKKRKIVATSADKVVRRKRGKIGNETVLNAILARKAEVVRSKQLYVPKEDPVWSRICEDLGNRIAPSTLYYMACRKDVREVALKRHETQNSPSLIAGEDEDETAGTENFRNELNEMVFEDAITKLLRTVDSTDGLTKEIKELRKDLKELKNELRERDSNKLGSQDQPIELN